MTDELFNAHEEDDFVIDPDQYNNITDEDQYNLLEDIRELLEELENKLEDRIVALHNVQDQINERHSFMYYRDFVWKAQQKLNLLK